MEMDLCSVTGVELLYLKDQGLKNCFAISAKKNAKLKHVLLVKFTQLKKDHTTVNLADQLSNFSLTRWKRKYTRIEVT